MAWPFTNEPKIEPEIKPAADTPPKEKTAAEQVSDSIAAALSPFADTLNKINERVQKMEERTQPKPKTAGEQPQSISVLEDEDAAFGQRLGPVVLRQLELEARIVKDQIEREYTSAGFGDIWSQYRGDIDKTLNGSQLYTTDGQGGVKALRGDPEYIRNVVDMIFGRAARAAGMKFDGKNKSFFLETAGGDSGAGKGKPVDDGMTADQRKVFSRMGVSSDDAKKAIGKLRFVS